MDRVDELTAIVRQEISDYARVRGWKSNVYYVEDDQHQIYTIIAVPAPGHPLLRKASVTLLVRVVDDKVIIDQDLTDRPLYETLMESGIPREQIILAYAGERLPETTDQND
ncbi:MAG: XisI protein [Chloroflexi bacterium]|nr:XisI protein [Chloroflexota bacterium]